MAPDLGEQIQGQGRGDHKQNKSDHQHPVGQPKHLRLGGGDAPEGNI
jgi:hypothetical protein